MTNQRLSQHVFLSQGFLLSTLFLFASACKGPSTFIPTNTDSFTNRNQDFYQQADAVLQADYLFVMDYSFSMFNKREEVFSAIDDFRAYLQTEQIDYRLGFVKGTTHNNSVSTIATAFMGPILGIDTSASLATDIMTQVANVGAPLQENTNFMLEAAKRTMAAKASTFVRPAAQLVYVFMSDSDDKSQNFISSDTTTTGYINALKSYKNNGAYVSARSYTAGLATDCALVNDWDVAGERLAQVGTGLDNAAQAPLCIYTPMATALEDLARNVTKPANRFALIERPLAGSLRVQVSGVDVQASGNWDYVAATNEVVFQAGREPALSSDVSFRYEMVFALSKTPRENTIAVSINGNNIARDGKNGFSYIAAENRIAFHGSASPIDGDRVQITYQSK